MHVHAGPSDEDSGPSGKTYKRHSKIFAETEAISEGVKRKKSRLNSASGGGGNFGEGSRPGSATGRVSPSNDGKYLRGDSTDQEDGNRNDNNYDSRDTPDVDMPGIASSNFYGVREHSGRWIAHTQEQGVKFGAGVHTILAQFLKTEFEAAYVYDIHTYRTRTGSKAQLLNFPHLIPVYTRLLANGLAPSASSGEYEASVGKITAAVQGIALPPGYKPPLQRLTNGDGMEKLQNGFKRGGSAQFGRSVSQAFYKDQQQGEVSFRSGSGRPRKVAAGDDFVSGRGAGAGAGQQRGGRDSDHDEDMEDSEQLEDRYALRAKELASHYPSIGMLGPESRRPTLAMVEIKPASEVPDQHCWHMGWMRCPANATVEWIAEAVAAGHAAAQEWELEQQSDGGNHKSAAHGGGGSATGGGTQEVIKLAGSNILLHAVNELDADADFAAVYAADTCADGTLALRRHLTVRDLLLVLADCGEDLVLEYTLAGI